MLVDASSITMALQSMKAATDTLKVLRQADHSLETAEYKLKIADLASALADARMQLADVQTYVHEVERRLDLSESLKFDRDCSVYRDAEGAAFCAKCLDSDRKACRMHETTSSHHCISCGREIYKPGYPKSPPRPRPRGRSWQSEL